MFTYYNERVYCRLNFLFQGRIILAIMCLLKDASTFKIFGFIIAFLEIIRYQMLAL